MVVTTRLMDSHHDGSEKVIGDRDKSSGSWTATVDELNAQFLKTDERVTAISSQLVGFIAEVRAALPTLNPTDKSGSNDDSSSDELESNTVATGGSATMTMPNFDGSNALEWLARAEQYFLVSNTPKAKRVKVAMVTLAGPALPWYQLLRKRVPNLSWDRFTRELMKRFGSNGALDEYEAFAAVHHTGSLAEYVAAFEARLAQISNLADHQYLGFFMAALRPEILLQMKAAKVTSYADAVELAISIDLMSGTKPLVPAATAPVAAQSGPTFRPASKGYSQTPSSFSSAGSARPKSHRFRSISQEEYNKHIAAGACIKCGLKYGPTHRCPPKTLNVLVYEEDVVLDTLV